MGSFNNDLADMRNSWWQKCTEFCAQFFSRLTIKWNSVHISQSNEFVDECSHQIMLS